MFSRTWFLVATAVAVSACAPRQWPTTEPTPVPAPSQAPTPAPVVREAPDNWHLLDPQADGYVGISLLKAERELLAGRAPARTVIVAVIDNGVDTSHSKLRPQLWTNADETPGNRRDDDNNGYADDIRGWSFIGSADGRNVHEDTYEVTRLAAQCSRSSGRDSLRPDLRQRCPEIEDRKSTRLNSSHGYISYAVFCLKKKIKNRSYTKTVEATERTCHAAIGLRAPKLQFIACLTLSLHPLLLLYLLSAPPDKKQGITP